MSVLPIHVERAALEHAFGAPEGVLGEIPAAERAGTIGAVAQKLGLKPSEVRTILEIHWLESSGRAGAEALSGKGRKAACGGGPAGTFDALSIQLLGFDDDGPAHNAASVHAQFAGEAATRVKLDQPLDYETDLSRRNRELDGLLPPGRPGEYGQLRLQDVPDDDPRLELRIFRGMGGVDPAQVALQITKHLVPEGTSGSYDQFKTYDHRDPLDAYEWTLDPFVAAKSAGGRGALVSMTLGELKAQGADVFRKRADSEGGIFVASVVAPEHRVVAHEDGAYRLSSRRAPSTAPEAKVAAKKLRAALEQDGGWEKLAEARPKLAQTLTKGQAVEAERVLRHWLARLEAASPGDPTIARLEKKLAAAPEGPPQLRLRTLDALRRAALLRLADFLDTPAEKIWQM